MANKITQKRLKELFSYSEVTGLFTRINKTSRFKSGTVAGFLRKDGYVQIKVDYVNYLAHRLAWIYVSGEIPAGEIDHVNHKRSDNAISNLRDVSRLENSKNLSASKNGSGATGVRFLQTRSKYVASISDAGRVVFLGHFDNHQDAAHARKIAENKYGYHENHGQIRGN